MFKKRRRFRFRPTRVWRRRSRVEVSNFFTTFLVVVPGGRSETAPYIVVTPILTQSMIWPRVLGAAGADPAMLDNTIKRVRLRGFKFQSEMTVITLAAGIRAIGIVGEAIIKDKASSSTGTPTAIHNLWVPGLVTPGSVKDYNPYDQVDRILYRRVAMHLLSKGVGNSNDVAPVPPLSAQCGYWGEMRRKLQATLEEDDAIYVQHQFTNSVASAINIAVTMWGAVSYSVYRS